MITPHILPRNSSGVTTQEPPLVEQYLQPIPQKSEVPPPPPAFRQPATPRVGSAMPPAPTSTVASPAEAAATLLKSSQSSLPVMRNEAETETGTALVRPLTSEEQRTLSRSHRQGEAKKASDAQDRMKQVQVDRDQDRAGQAQRAKLATEQGKRDEAAAKTAAEQARNQAKIDAKAAKIAAEQAKRQSALEQERQKALDEAAAIAKAAEARYQTELAKKQR